MIVILKKGVKPEEVESLSSFITCHAPVAIQPVDGMDASVLCLTGDTHPLDAAWIESFPCVERVVHVSGPYRKVSRSSHPEKRIIQAGNVCIGGRKLTVIAGPCSVESPEQITGIARSVQLSGASLLRGGAFKPRTSPYVFQGLQWEGLKMLKNAREATGLPIVSEIMSPVDIERFVEDVDILQVGARNMQNYDLLRHLGRVRKPVLLKRGLSATIEEWLMSAEYIMSEGNEQVILCERGIRSFETCTRNTLDLSAIPAVHRLSHLPILVDPSHGTGKRWMVGSMARAAVAAGADGIMIEVHNDPMHALCDGQQSVTPEEFAQIMNELRPIAAAIGREM